MSDQGTEAGLVGFVGVGAMGGAVAQRLIDRGVSLIVYDPDSQATGRLAARGALVAGSPREVADRAETVFACLPSPKICREVALGPDGVAGGDRILYYIETSTMGGASSTDIAKALEGHGIAMLDAPISGGISGAAAGTLTAIIAGPNAVVEVCRPLIDLYASSFFHVSERQGGAQLSKLINNAICIYGMLLTFEGMAVADEAGLDKATLTALLNVSSGANFTSRVLIPNGLLADQPQRAGRMEVMLKDLHLYMDEVHALGLELPVAPMLTQITEDAGPDPDQDPPEALYRYFSKVAKGLAAVAD